MPVVFYRSHSCLILSFILTKSWYRFTSEEAALDAASTMNGAEFLPLSRKLHVVFPFFSRYFVPRSSKEEDNVEQRAKRIAAGRARAHQRSRPTEAWGTGLRPRQTPQIPSSVRCAPTTSGLPGVSFFSPRSQPAQAYPRKSNNGQPLPAAVSLFLPPPPPRNPPPQLHHIAARNQNTLPAATFATLSARDSSPAPAPQYQRPTLPPTGKILPRETVSAPSTPPQNPANMQSEENSTPHTTSGATFRGSVRVNRFGSPSRVDFTLPDASTDQDDQDTGTVIRRPVQSRVRLPSAWRQDDSSSTTLPEDEDMRLPVVAQGKNTTGGIHGYAAYRARRHQYRLPQFGDSEVDDTASWNALPFEQIDTAMHALADTDARAEGHDPRLLEFGFTKEESHQGAARVYDPNLSVEHPSTMSLVLPPNIPAANPASNLTSLAVTEEGETADHALPPPTEPPRVRTEIRGWSKDFKKEKYRERHSVDLDGSTAQTDETRRRQEPSTSGYRATAGGSLKMVKTRPAPLKVNTSAAQEYGKDQLPELQKQQDAVSEEPNAKKRQQKKRSKKGKNKPDVSEPVSSSHKGAHTGTSESARAETLLAASEIPMPSEAAKDDKKLDEEKTTGKPLSATSHVTPQTEEHFKKHGSFRSLPLTFDPWPRGPSISHPTLPTLAKDGSPPSVDANKSPVSDSDALLLKVDHTHTRATSLPADTSFPSPSGQLAPDQQTVLSTSRGSEYFTAVSNMPSPPDNRASTSSGQCAGDASMPDKSAGEVSVHIKVDEPEKSEVVSTLPGGSQSSQQVGTSHYEPGQDQSSHSGENNRAAKTASSRTPKSHRKHPKSTSGRKYRHKPKMSRSSGQSQESNNAAWRPNPQAAEFSMASPHRSNPTSPSTLSAHASGSAECGSESRPQDLMATVEAPGSDGLLAAGTPSLIGSHSSMQVSDPTWEEAQTSCAIEQPLAVRHEARATDEKGYSMAEGSPRSAAQDDHAGDITTTPTGIDNPFFDECDVFHTSDWGRSASRIFTPDFKQGRRSRRGTSSRKQHHRRSTGFGFTEMMSPSEQEQTAVAEPDEQWRDQTANNLYARPRVWIPVNQSYYHFSPYGQPAPGLSMGISPLALYPHNLGIMPTVPYGMMIHPPPIPPVGYG